MWQQVGFVPKAAMTLMVGIAEVGRALNRVIEPSTHFHRNLIRAGSEFGSRMSHLSRALPAWNDDSGY
jgi:hypothetical protein